ncbi:hypothetical protein HanHA300_Chr16g0597271 [Helianthus annuus]|nr:hypothetical protein HanHA300_Chr16g0597271 [Helianthus annuus]KAJ0459331.1 hypothetical protein HanHA89_Chr16g0647741 [Helianthus annuus]
MQQFVFTPVYTSCVNSAFHYFIFFQYLIQPHIHRDEVEMQQFVFTLVYL